MIIAGIDPDFKGGIAAVSYADPEAPAIVMVARVPVRQYPGYTKGKTYKRVDASKVLSIFEEYTGDIDRVIVEQALVMRQASNGKAHFATMGIHTTHQTYGALYALAEVFFGAECVHYAPPSSWKRMLGLTSNKGDSLALAQEMFPSHSKLWGVKANTGIAEAALMTVWAHRRITEGKPLFG